MMHGDDGMKGKGSYLGAGSTKTKFVKTQNKLPGLPKGGQASGDTFSQNQGKNISFPSDTEDVIYYYLFLSFISL